MKNIFRLIIFALAVVLAGTGPAIAADYPCQPPAVSSATGYVPREKVPFPAINDTLGINGGGTWNKVVYPYFLCLGTANDFAVTTLKDTPNDRGLTDPSFKRRSEFETTSKFQNDLDSWVRFEFTVHVDGLTPALSVRGCQAHWPSGASPAFGCTFKGSKTGLRFVMSMKNDATGNVPVANVALSQDVVHSFVANFKFAKAGYLRVWLDGKQIVAYSGFIGSVKENGYRLRLGNYGQLNGATVTTKYRNITTPKQATTNMSAYINAPPAW